MDKGTMMQAHMHYRNLVSHCTAYRVPHHGAAEVGRTRDGVDGKKGRRRDDNKQESVAQPDRSKDRNSPARPQMDKINSELDLRPSIQNHPDAK